MHSFMHTRFCVSIIQIERVFVELYSPFEEVIYFWQHCTGNLSGGIATAKECMKNYEFIKQINNSFVNISLHCCRWVVSPVKQGNENLWPVINSFTRDSKFFRNRGLVSGKVTFWW